MESKDKELIDKRSSKKNSWFQTTISILIGILFTIGTTWYTIYINKAEAERSELERYNKVKDNLVSIIEEHIVNKDSIDIASLNRIINNRVKEESLYRKPEVIDLFSLAEYNIQNSKHLNFDKKIDYSRLLSNQIRKLKADTILNVQNVRFPDEINSLNNNLSNINSEKGKESLIKLINKYEEEIKNLEEKKIKKESISDFLFKSPSKLLIIFSCYLLAFVLYFYYIRNRRRKRILIRRRYEIFELESQKIKEEIEHLVSRLNSDNIEEKERINLNDRIQFLFEKLKNMDKDYR